MGDSLNPHGFSRDGLLNEVVVTGASRDVNRAANDVEGDWPMSFLGMAPGSDGKARPPRIDLEGPMHHRRTVGLDIPCQVALLQSLTPLLQAEGV